MEPAKIHICPIRILYFKSVRFGFVTQSQLAQFSQVKNAKFCLQSKGVYWELDCVFFLFIFVFLCIIILLIIYCNPLLSTGIIKHTLPK